MFANLNLPIIIAVIVAGVIGFVTLVMGGGKIKHENLDELDDYDQQRAINDAAGIGDGGYYGKLDD